MSALAEPKAEPLDPVAALEARHWRLAQTVDAISRQRRTKILRSRILLMLLDVRCPLEATPRRRWYVRGAVARFGVRGILDRWREWWGEDPVQKRAMQSHLAELERAGCIRRAPGDWIPCIPDPDREHRPRFRDTIHVVDTEAEAEWWTQVGHELLARNPAARVNPDAWERVLGDWRRAAAARAHHQPTLFDMIEAGVDAPKVARPTPPPSKVADPAAAAADLLDAARTFEDSRTVLGVLDRVLDRPSDRLRGRPRLHVQTDAWRLRGAIALLAAAFARGDTVRNPAGWVYRAWRHAPTAELDRALAEPARRRRRQAEPLSTGDLIAGLKLPG